MLNVYIHCQWYVFIVRISKNINILKLNKPNKGGNTEQTFFKMEKMHRILTKSNSVLQKMTISIYATLVKLIKKMSNKNEHSGRERLSL